MPHHSSPRLDHCPEGLPRAAYLDEGWYAREQERIFGRAWLMVGRLSDFTPGTLRRVESAGAPVMVARSAEGGVSVWHNSCPHRGSELCVEEEEPLGKLIRCPYHAFAFAALDGRLISTGYAKPTEDFDRSAHGLRPVQHRLWNGFLFLSLADQPGDLGADPALTALDNWPMQELVSGHRWTTDIACNWKAFWENYSECLHCPGVHPELCDRVPIYRKGIMSPQEAADWMPEAAPAPNLKPGAESWTPDGRACGPVFQRLTEAERAEGYRFVTFWPSAYVVAHVDYVRSVRVVPLGPERTRLIAEWHFLPETLSQHGFDPAQVARFAKIVMQQDGAISELNHRGMRSPAFKAARLMPEEFEIRRFHNWVMSQLEGSG